MVDFYGFRLGHRVFLGEQTPSVHRCDGVLVVPRGFPLVGEMSVEAFEFLFGELLEDGWGVLVKEGVIVTNPWELWVSEELDRDLEDLIDSLGVDLFLVGRCSKGWQQWGVLSDFGEWSYPTVALRGSVLKFTYTRLGEFVELVWELGKDFEPGVVREHMESIGAV